MKFFSRALGFEFLKFKSLGLGDISRETDFCSEAKIRSEQVSLATGIK